MYTNQHLHIYKTNNTILIEKLQQQKQKKQNIIEKKIKKTKMKTTKINKGSNQKQPCIIGS